MNSQQLLYINILIGVLIVLYFVFGRKKARQVARLRMRDLPKDMAEDALDSTESKNEADSTESENEADSIASKAEAVIKENNIIQFNMLAKLPASSPAPEAAEARPVEAEQTASIVNDESPKVNEPSPAVVIPMPVAPPKTFKVYFAFNGHDWEAYEALGVPVNAPLTTVTKMYQHLIKTSDSSTFDFYESAYSAIIQRRKEQK